MTDKTGQDSAGRDSGGSGSGTGGQTGAGYGNNSEEKQKGDTSEGTGDRKN